MARLMDIITPLRTDALLFEGMSGNEELGRLSQYDIRVLSERNDIDPDDLLGRNVTVRLALPDDRVRCFDAYVTRFGLTGTQGRYYRYQILARPWLWFLTRTSDCRVFQSKTVPEIVVEIFDKYPTAQFENRLTGDYYRPQYCVQYRETDFNFVSRLMEQEGIYYYFEHQEGKHTLVLADAYSAHKPFTGYETVAFSDAGDGPNQVTECINSWRFAREVQPGRYTLEDYSFEKPSAELLVSTRLERNHAQSNYEYFDYPGGYASGHEGDKYARIRLEELQTRYETCEGTTNARGIVVGHLFSLANQPRQDQNTEFLVTAVHFRLDSNPYEARASAGEQFACSFSAISAKESYRTPRSTPRPVVQGPQTAFVVGAAGDEIHTDRHGRIKVQFHWDRHGKGDENSSCWIRVSQPWAGKGWGSISVPRVGQEVIVDFLEGDPDRPLITGRIYNAESMPPYPLPGGAVVSGIKSSTHKGKGSNEISMDDTAGKEKFNINAQHDMSTTVGHDQSSTVKNNRSTSVLVNDTVDVDGNRTVHVKGKLTEIIDTGQEVTVSSGYKETVTGGASSTISGGLTSTINGKWDNTVNGHLKEVVTSGEEQEVAGGRKLTVTGGYAEEVTGDRKTNVIGPLTQTTSATMSLHADAEGSYTSNASLRLAVVGSVVEITSSAITISSSGSIIKVDAAGVSINGAKISLNG